MMMEEIGFIISMCFTELLFDCNSHYYCLTFYGHTALLSYDVLLIHTFIGKL